MIGVAVMGCGVVGYGVVEMLLENREAVSRAVKQDVRPLYMLDIRNLDVPEGVTLTHSFDDIIADPSVQIVVETIGGCRVAYDYTRRALESGRHVVTSNKELVATHGDELTQIAAEHRVSYLFEASVGGGIPVLHPIMRCLQGNRLTGVDGIVNGSTNYLLTQMKEKGVSFPAALGEAKRLGYVEANPDADVEGWDARRKLAILASCCFGSHFSDEALIPTQGISAITENDMRAAQTFDCAVKLIAHAELSADGESWSGWVHPCCVPSAHPLYNVCDVFNGIIVHGDYVGDVMFFGRGAGRKATASAVVGDILDVARESGRFIAPAEFERVPGFRTSSDAPRRRLMRASLASQAVMAEYAPDWQTRPVFGELAVMTPALTDAQFDADAAALSSKGVVFSSPLYALSL